MPRYYFHTADGGESHDPEGVELADVVTAKIEAIRLAGAILEQEPGMLLDGHDFALRVCDEARQTLFMLTIAVTGNGSAPT